MGEKRLFRAMIAELSGLCTAFMRTVFLLGSVGRLVHIIIATGFGDGCGYVTVAAQHWVGVGLAVDCNALYIPIVIFAR